MDVSLKNKLRGLTGTGLTALLVLLAGSNAFADSPPSEGRNRIAVTEDRLEPAWTVNGVHADTELRSLAPQSKSVTDEQALQVLLDSWQPEHNGEFANIDFATHFLIVETVASQNRARLRNIVVDSQGDVNYGINSSRRAGPGFGYVFVLLERGDIKSIKGEALPERIPAATADLIKVDVTGSLQTGVMAIGGESTGVTITSSGIVWELEFEQMPADLDNMDRVRVTGTLVRLQGVEIPARWIVKVDSISAEAGHGDTGEPESDDIGFSTISIRRSGGFAGLDQMVLVTSGQVIRNSNGEQSTMSDERFADLKTALAAIDLQTAVEEQGVSNIGADLMKYDFEIQTENDTCHFTYDDGTLRGRRELMQLVQILFE